VWLCTRNDVIANIARLANRAIHSTRRYDTSVDDVGVGQQSWLTASFETL